MTEWRVSFRVGSPRLLLAHPDAPCERSGLLIGHWAAGDLEGQLHLAVMVALMPDHVLEHEDGMVVVKFHILAGLHPARLHAA